MFHFQTSNKAPSSYISISNFYFIIIILRKKLREREKNVWWLCQKKKIKKVVALNAMLKGENKTPKENK